MIIDNLTELRQANKAANAIIGQQADEAKTLQDRIDFLENRILKINEIYEIRLQKKRDEIRALREELYKK